MIEENPQNKNGREKTATVWVLIICVAVVVFWEVMSSRSNRPFDKFTITAADFEGTPIQPEGWTVEKLPLNAGHLEPNILALDVRPSSPPQIFPSVLVRLAHGYNMPDCMRIKGYKVEAKQTSYLGEERLKGDEQTSDAQIWRVVSPGGDVSVWATSMLRSHDFAVTGRDIRTMAFPRIGTPDDPRWIPEGLTWKSLRHPVRNLRWYIRAKWNNSRCDLATFLKLKRPAWADDDLLTLVSAWTGKSVEPEDEPQVLSRVLAAHGAVMKELQSAAAGGRKGREK